MKSRRIVAAGTVLGGAAVAAALMRRPAKTRWAAGTMPGRSGSWLNSYLNRPIYRRMASALDLRPEDEFLDVACGWGEFLAVHAAPVRRVAGIDHAEAKITLARQRLEDRIASGTAEVVLGDAESLPWGDGTFSAVTCMDAFGFFPAPERVLAETLRVLRPGGRMVMQIGMDWPDGPPERLVHPGVPTHSDEIAVRRMVEGAGFADVAISYVLVGGDSRLANRACRLAFGSDQFRLVAGVKPLA